MGKQLCWAVLVSFYFLELIKAVLIVKLFDCDKKAISSIFSLRMPWQGNKENMIDRFDVRAHLDYIPEISHRNSDDELDADELRENRIANYERYRILIQNDFLKSNFYCSFRFVLPEFSSYRIKCLFAAKNVQRLKHNPCIT